ncbi:MAG: phage major capsid domain-containing protein, partial [Candidatus Fonsibacter sp.]
MYNVAVPTLETIISREVLWKSTVMLKITTENRPAGVYAMNYCVTDALAPFPLHSLVNVMSATINNNTVYFNVQEMLPLLLRMVDPEEFANYDSMTPTALDYLADYDGALYPMEYFLKAADGVNASSQSTLYAATDVDTKLDYAHDKHYGEQQQTLGSYAKNVLAYDMNRP